jgi:DEAD/DEAH box helicase domain-containing protein
MEPTAFIEHLKLRKGYRGQIVRVEELPEREAEYGSLPESAIDLRVLDALSEMGIGRLYLHQAEAIGHVIAGRNVVVVTGTASGKTLCYNVPVVDAILKDPLATALFIYPTKALAQDQLRAINKFCRESEQAAGTQRSDDSEDDWKSSFPQHSGQIKFVAGAYDGDTPQNERKRLRDRGAVILTNPDMLHQGILPRHSHWNRVFSNLRYVVLDEVHSYRGVFGSHLANVLRRLRRICAHYGSHPQFICCSATIGNPREHAERIVGEPMELVEHDGSPRGPKKFVFWNPPVLVEHSASHNVISSGASAESRNLLSDAVQGGGGREKQISRSARNDAAGETPAAGGERRSSLGEAVELMTSLVKEDIQTIAFVRTRLMAELILRSARERLGGISPRLAKAVQAYRSGYLPEERREIERKLSTGEILGVASTNALELGIDIGSLDASILVGYPGTIASTWQQAGRAGRKGSESAVFLVGENSPIDQYLMAHQDYLFAESPEQAVVDPDNPHIAVGHIKAAAFELPITDPEVTTFGEFAAPILEILQDDGCVKHIENRWYWASPDYPAAETNLRNIAGAVYTIQDQSEASRVIGTMDEVSALAMLHTHAVYLHGADTYFVESLDFDKKIAFVTKRDLDYYTQSIQTSKIRIDETEETVPWRNASVGIGDVTVTTTIPMFKKVKFHSRDSLGFEKLDLPPQSLETVSMWLVPPDSAGDAVRADKKVLAEGLVGIANALVECAPLYVMCDVRDIGAVVDASNLGKDALFLYDRYPGGMGYAQRCCEAIEELMQAVHEVIRTCPCEDGCPSCVGAALPAFALTDIDSGTRGRMPDKHGALIILRELFGG